MKPNILLLMSGSIACAKATALISTWVKQGHQVQVACTRSVAEFVGNATLEGFSGRPVLADVFAPGQVMDHIHLARWADLVVAAPATSNLINKLSAGIADDAVTSLWQAAFDLDKPMIIVPAMNSHMWHYPATQESVRRLQSWGVKILPPAAGALACGEVGAGRMLEPEDIVRRIAAVSPGRALARPLRILVTAGGTREPIDAVRYIGNTSTGRTAAVLTDALAARGHAVTWLGAESAMRPQLDHQAETFVSYRDLAEALQQLLAKQPFDVVLQAAAVSDFSVARIDQGGSSGDLPQGKLPSSSEIRLHLQPNPKLLQQLRGWSGQPLRIIAFKLTHAASAAERQQAVAGLFDQAGADAVVHNDLQDMQEGQHPYTLFRSKTDSVACADSGELAGQIERLLEEAP
jgi:phosphopantothenoylcysteine decarboxylase/phosphopantothenate--cysteine ligase